jgi:hypothetical protein
MKRMGSVRKSCIVGAKTAFASLLMSLHVDRSAHGKALATRVMRELRMTVPGAEGTG